MVAEFGSPSGTDLEEVNARLRSEVAAHKQALANLAAEREPLQLNLAQRTQELAAMKLRVEELGQTLARYEAALQGSRVTVFTQDADLRYTSISNEFLGQSADEIVGREDVEVFPPENGNGLALLKSAALKFGTAQDSELRIKGENADLWLDLHVEPLRDPAGDPVGITGVAVDITQRKESEAHLRLLMREITHRSKNLLAVIQAMARQTARHCGSIDTFLEQFGARLQALAASHDLLVSEGWHGASLHDLVQSQLSTYQDRFTGRINYEGPPIRLKPEAAQALGLALHELVSNAVKYGALSGDRGTVTVSWRRQLAADGSGVEFVWAEQAFAEVKPPARRGFGSSVIERHLARSLDTDVELHFASEGVRCRVQIPLVQFVAMP